MILFLLSSLFLPYNVFFGGLNHTSRQVQGLRLTVARLVKIQFQLLSFALTLAILVSKNCKALQGQTKMQIINVNQEKRN